MANVRYTKYTEGGASHLIDERIGIFHILHDLNGNPDNAILVMESIVDSKFIIKSYELSNNKIVITDNYNVNLEEHPNLVVFLSYETPTEQINAIHEQALLDQIDFEKQQANQNKLYSASVSSKLTGFDWVRSVLINEIEFVKFPVGIKDFHAIKLLQPHKKSCSIS